MFENGLLTTFIPEFFMVFAFLFCLIAPDFKTSKTTYEVTPKVILTVSQHLTSSSVYNVSSHHFNQLNLIEKEKSITFTSFIDVHHYFLRKIPLLCDYFFCINFSRPPPISIIA